MCDSRRHPCQFACGKLTRRPWRRRRTGGTARPWQKRRSSRRAFRLPAPRGPSRARQPASSYPLRGCGAEPPMAALGRLSTSRIRQSFVRGPRCHRLAHGRANRECVTRITRSDRCLAAVCGWCATTRPGPMPVSSSIGFTRRSRPGARARIQERGRERSGVQPRVTGGHGSVRHFVRGSGPGSTASRPLSPLVDLHTAHARPRQLLCDCCYTRSHGKQRRSHRRGVCGD